MHTYKLDIQSGELYHFRTPGSKNGIRRWQNKDGSLTPEGYIHYGITPPGQRDTSPVFSDNRWDDPHYRSTGESTVNRIFSDDRWDDRVNYSKSVDIGKEATNKLFSKKQIKAAKKAEQKAVKEAKKAEAKAIKEAKKDKKTFDNQAIAGYRNAYSGITKNVEDGKRVLDRVFDDVSDFNYLSSANRDLAKKYKRMSDDQLAKIVYRQNLENQYLNARANRAKYSVTRKAGKVFTSTAAAGATIAAGVYFTKKILSD